MEDLFMNFADHLSHIISPVLGNQVKQHLRRRLCQRNSPVEYIDIENEIKSIMTNYFENASDKDYLDMSANLYNSYVEYDDENFIKSVKLFVRIYSYYQELKLRKLFSRWKINTIKLKMQSNNKMNNKISNTKDKSLHRNKSAGYSKLPNSNYGNKNRNYQY